MGRMVDPVKDLPSVSPVASLPVHHAAKLGAGSCGGFPVDLHRYRTVFPDRWAALLRDHFNGDVRTIMFAFDASERCVRDWLAGKTGPNASTAIYAAATIPGAVAYLMRAA